ncbi:hypothetical protein YDYSG_57210 [Paenibacillus tyrfis]|nr:hypothetical protein YDYSG_57210 [Paenibacillus tyrfis]
MYFLYFRRHPWFGGNKLLEFLYFVRVLFRRLSLSEYWNPLPHALAFGTLASRSWHEKCTEGT